MTKCKACDAPPTGPGGKAWAEMPAAGAITCPHCGAPVKHVSDSDDVEADDGDEMSGTGKVVVGAGRKVLDAGREVMAQNKKPNLLAGTEDGTASLARRHRPR